jgi:DNA-binding NtrC family response regulator
MRFRGRVIAATNRSLDSLRKRDLFRQDFFYRLCSDMIEVPPLRQRLQQAPKELRQLIEHTLTRMLGEPALELVAHVESSLRRAVDDHYPWPGNVRELEQAIRRILVTGHYAADASPRSASLREQLIAGIESQTLNAENLLASYCKVLYETSGNYEAVGRRTNLDRRTVKKYVKSAPILQNHGRTES